MRETRSCHVEEPGDTWENKAGGHSFSFRPGFLSGLPLGVILRTVTGLEAEFGTASAPSGRKWEQQHNTCLKKSLERRTICLRPEQRTTRAGTGVTLIIISVSMWPSCWCSSRSTWPQAAFCKQPGPRGLTTRQGGAWVCVCEIPPRFGKL